MTIVLIQNDYFNAIYEDGALKRDGKPERLDIETLAHEYPNAEIYLLDDTVYDELLDGAGYPAALADVPLERLQRIR